jgi:ADP-heptose:LPS heptosyltransferase
MTVVSLETPRILISRMSALGDTILTLPVACALREKFPRAYLGWVVELGASAVVHGHECLDAIITLPRGWFRKPSTVLAARQKLKPHRFQFSIDCQSRTKSSLACWLSGAKTRIGCRGRYGAEWSPYLNNLLIEPISTHLTDRSLELLVPLGIVEPTVQWKYPLSAEAAQRASEIALGLGVRDRYAVINPGASRDSRLWEMRRFGHVAQHLGERHKLPSVVVWGNKREEHWAQEIVATSSGHATLAPTTDLTTLAAFIKHGRLFVSGDTGPLHLAVAVRTPSIALHGVTRPENSGPYGTPHIAIRVLDDDGSQQHRPTDNSAMLLITSERVCRECDRMLASDDGKQYQAA